jgi:PKD repeat protein
MMSRPRLVILTLTILFASSAAFGSVQVGLRSAPVTLNKPTQYITDIARDFLIERDGDTATVWVFFTDKAVFDRSEFRQAASSVQLTERALKRRAKVGRDQILFTDLPVSRQYIDEVVELGASFRRTSRWLNAASFEIPMIQLDAVGSLPFVAYLKPVIRYQTALPVDFDPNYRPLPPPVAQSPDALTYGGSLTQLNQINVPEVHSQGYTGQGVTLAIMDTGFRTSHEAFALHVSSGRLLAQWDFVFNDDNTSNQPGDWSTAWNHGTLIWSVSAGERDGSIYGPAYRSNIILCKTEDVRSETTVEEDNWVAALEFADSLGADVTTTSLTYGYPGGWYDYSDVDGLTATITLAANTADSLGIVACNAMGNSGPGTGSLSPPADAFGMLSVGAVNDDGFIASFSSRGPTYDGRPKPEVVAMGVSTFAGTAAGDDTYGGASGTSLSTPLVAGAACLLIEARPSFTPAMIRQALMETASMGDNPDSTTYGHGIIDVAAALRWGCDFTADTLFGNAPISVQFTGISNLSPTSWQWDFGDGDSADIQNPSHEYTLPGSYTVNLTVETPYGPITSTRANYIVAMGDTLEFESDSVFAGAIHDLSVRLHNSQPLERIVIPFDLPEGDLDLSMVEVLFGERTSYFESKSFLIWDPNNERYSVELVADDGGGSPPLPAGDGEVMVIRVRSDRTIFGGLSDTVTTGSTPVSLESTLMTYEPIVHPAEIVTKFVQRCDADYSNDGILDIGDLTSLIGYLYIPGSPAPPTLQSGDCDANLRTDIGDLTFLIQFLYLEGDPPISP